MACEPPTSVTRGGAPPLVVAVLAAGASRRLGRAKQLVTLAGETLVHRAGRVAVEADVGPVLLVVGCGADACIAAARDLPVEIHLNDEWAEGLAASIRVATRAAASLGAAGLLVFHCDQYRVAPDDLRRLRDAWLVDPRLARLSTDGDRYLGPPAILPAGRFPTLLTLTGDRGARAALGEEGEGWSRVHLPAAAADLDEPGQLAALEK